MLTCLNLMSQEPVAVQAVSVLEAEAVKVEPVQHQMNNWPTYSEWLSPSKYFIKRGEMYKCLITM
jgi:hypothetical protein